LSSLLAFLRHSSIFSVEGERPKQHIAACTFPSGFGRDKGDGSSEQDRPGVQFVRYDVRKEEDWKALPTM
jgi:hypothetical protein